MEEPGFSAGGIGGGEVEGGKREKRGRKEEEKREKNSGKDCGDAEVFIGGGMGNFELGKAAIDGGCRVERVEVDCICVQDPRMNRGETIRVGDKWNKGGSGEEFEVASGRRGDTPGARVSRASDFPTFSHSESVEHDENRDSWSGESGRCWRETVIIVMFSLMVRAFIASFLCCFLSLLKWTADDILHPVEYLPKNMLGFFRMTLV